MTVVIVVMWSRMSTQKHFRQLYLLLQPIGYNTDTVTFVTHIVMNEMIIMYNLTCTCITNHNITYNQLAVCTCTLSCTCVN